MANIIKTNNKAPKKKLTKKQLALAVGGLVFVLIAVGVGGYLLLGAYNEKQEKDAEAAFIAREEERAEFATRANLGEVDDKELKAIFDSDMSDEDKAEKVSLYASYATLKEDITPEEQRTILNASMDAYELAEVVNLLWVIVELAEELDETEIKVKYQKILDTQLAEQTTTVEEGR